jgi:hypothetical protein
MNSLNFVQMRHQSVSRFRVSSRQSRRRWRISTTICTVYSMHIITGPLSKPVSSAYSCPCIPCHERNQILYKEFMHSLYTVYVLTVVLKKTSITIRFLLYTVVCIKDQLGTLHSKMIHLTNDISCFTRVWRSNDIQVYSRTCRDLAFPVDSSLPLLPFSSSLSARSSMVRNPCKIFD